MNGQRMIVVGGASLVAGAVAFVAVFSYLAANFSYPDVLDGAAAEVLPRLRSGGSLMRSVWAIYAFLPLLLIPGAVGAYFACPSSRARMTLALVVAVLGAFAMCLGLMRWPSINWALAEAYSRSSAETRIGLDAVFNGMNLYLGNYIGEFLGETALASFFMLSGLLPARRGQLSEMAWLVWSGVFAAVPGRSVSQCRRCSAGDRRYQQRPATAVDDRAGSGSGPQRRTPWP